MTADLETLAVYDSEAEAYETRVAEKASPGMTEFLEGLSPRSHVLDLGCGPGLSALAMIEAGHTVDAVDGSTAMVARAREKGVCARHALFSDIETVDAYNGIWANFSLLHLPRSEFEPVLMKLNAALRPDGLFHIGMKLGSGQDRDRLGRYYCYYQQDELLDALRRCGFSPRSQTLGAGRGLEGTISDWIVVLAHG